MLEHDEKKWIRERLLFINNQSVGALNRDRGLMGFCVLNLIFSISLLLGGFNG